MKKKIVTILLISTLALTACGKESQVQSSDSSTQTQEESNTSNKKKDTSKADTINVDKNLFDVKITIPADFVGETTQEELDAQAKESDIHSITLNDDGSATYVMSKSQHKK